MEDLNKKSINSFAWKTAQSICSLGITFIIQLVLARMLMPEDFGIIAISTVFMTVANTIIETSFSSAVIQRENLDQNTLSSIYYANVVLSILVYILLYVSAPFIANFYGESILIPVLRVQGIRVIISAVYSIQQALMNRKMRFKALFFCNFIGVLSQALIGLLMAYNNYGVWALVISTSAGCAITGLIIIFVEAWKPSLYFSLSLVRGALDYSSKILVIRVVRKIFYNIRVLLIGRIYNTEVLGYFNKGFQFPSTAMTVVDGSLTSVAFTHLSKLQNNIDDFTKSLRQYVRIAMYVCTPIMIGMALVAKPMVLFLLTEKWIGCVPYLQIICISQLFVPLNLKTIAFEALGKSDLSLKLNITGIVISIILMVLSIPFSPLVMTFSGVISNILLHLLIAIETKKYFNYSIQCQLKDSMTALLPTTIMIGLIIVISFINFGQYYIIELIIKVMLGISSFVLTSIISNNEVFYSVLNIIKLKLKKEK